MTNIVCQEGICSWAWSCTAGTSAKHANYMPPHAFTCDTATQLLYSSIFFFSTCNDSWFMYHRLDHVLCISMLLGISITYVLFTLAAVSLPLLTNPLCHHLTLDGVWTFPLPLFHKKPLIITQFCPIMLALTWLNVFCHFILWYVADAKHAIAYLQCAVTFADTLPTLTMLSVSVWLLPYCYRECWIIRWWCPLVGVHVRYGGSDMYQRRSDWDHR